VVVDRRLKLIRRWSGRILNFCRRFCVPSQRRHHVGKGIVDQASSTTSGAGALIAHLMEHHHRGTRIPSSSSHALIGGIVGRRGRGHLGADSGGCSRRRLHLHLPADGIRDRSLLLLTISWLFVRSTPTARSLVPQAAAHLMSLYSLGHGGNDAQKTSASSGCC